MMWVLHVNNIIIVVLLVYTTDTIAQSNQLRYNAVDRELTSVGNVVGFVLIDADTDRAITNLTDGSIINLQTLPTRNLNIQALTDDDDGIVGSIQFGYNDITNFRMERIPPFALCGDYSPLGNYATCKELSIGQHTITATPNRRRSGYGISGIPFKITFSIVDAPSCTIPKVCTMYLLKKWFIIIYSCLKKISVCLFSFSMLLVG